MNTFDIVLLSHFIIEAIFSIIYVLWQFDVFDIDEEVICNIITALNTLETILLVLTLFVKYGKWGSFSLVAWYVINTIVLILQLIYADFGVGFKIGNIIWISFYVYLFCLEAFHIDLINLFLIRYGPSIVAFGESIKDTYWGDVIKSVIIVLIKLLFNLVVKKQYD